MEKNKQTTKEMAAYALHQMSDEVKNEVYLQLQIEHVKADVVQFSAEQGIPLSEEEIDDVVYTYVYGIYDPKRDRNVAYWRNLQSLMEATHWNGLIRNASERVLKEYRQLFREGNLCVRASGQLELDALTEIVAHMEALDSSAVPITYEWLKPYIMFDPLRGNLKALSSPPSWIECGAMEFRCLDKPSDISVKRYLENLNYEYGLTTADITYEDAHTVISIMTKENDGNEDGTAISFSDAARQVLSDIQKREENLNA